jgi:hypothetical protein
MNGNIAMHVGTLTGLCLARHDDGTAVSWLICSVSVSCSVSVLSWLV